MIPPIPAYSAPTPSTADTEHLRLLSIFHYIVAGITALFGCIPCIHLALGIAILAGAFPPGPRGRVPPHFFGVLLVVVASAVILCCWTLAVLMFLGARNLAHRHRHTFCFVVACIECFFFPFGIVLGVFTIIVLMRPTVKMLFGLSAPPPPATPAP